jgi:hypothetical protein
MFTCPWPRQFWWVHAPTSFEMVAEVDDETDIGRGLVSRCDVVDVVVPCWSAWAS